MVSSLLLSLSSIPNDIEGCHKKFYYLISRHIESFWMNDLSFVSKDIGE